MEGGRGGDRPQGILGVATVQQKVDVVCRIPPLHDEDVMRSHDEEHLQIVVHLLRSK